MQLLKELTDAPGPPGYEEPVRKLMVENMKPLADHVSYDGLGSVIAQQGSAGPRIMLDAHMDELGGMVRRVRPDGFVSIQMLGYWLDQALPDQRWVIIGSKGPVSAVSDLWDAHIAPHDPAHTGGPREVYLDAGARTPAEVEALGISPGDPVAPVTDFQVLANNRYVAKAWDDRVGCAVMVEVMRRPLHAPHPPPRAFTRHRSGRRQHRDEAARRLSARIVNPDIGSSLEVFISNDVPGIGGPEAGQENSVAGRMMLYSLQRAAQSEAGGFCEAKWPPSGRFRCNSTWCAGFRR